MLFLDYLSDTNLLIPSIYRLFLSVVAVQPAKLYYITLLVNNTEAEDILLAASDSQPASGFTMKGQTCNRVVKKLRNPSPVKFRVWGVSTDKPFLLNGEREISVVPSDFEQDVTEMSIRLVKPGGKCCRSILCILNFSTAKCKCEALFELL